MFVYHGNCYINLTYTEVILFRYIYLLLRFHPYFMVFKEKEQQILYIFFNLFYV